MSDNGQDDKPQDAAPDMDPGAGASVPSIMYNGNQVQQEVVAAVNSTMAVGNQMIAPLLFRAQTLEWLLMRSQGTVFTLQQMMSVLSFREQEHHQLLEGMMNENSRLVDKCNRLEQNRAFAAGDAGETFDAIDSTVTHLEQFLLYTQRAAHGDKSFERWMLKAVQLECENDDLRKQVADLQLKHEDDRKRDQQCIEELQVEKNTLQQAKVGLKRELEKSKKTIAGLEKQVSDVQLEATVYEEVCQELRTDVGKLKAQLHREKELSQELRTDVGNLKAQLHKEKEAGGADQQKLMAGLKAQFKELINDMGQCCVQFEKDVKWLTADADNTNKQREEQKAAMEKVKKHAADKEKKLKEANKDLRAKIEKHKAEMEAQKEEIQSKHDKRVLIMRQELYDQTRRIESLEEQNAKLTEKNEAYSKQVVNAGKGLASTLGLDIDFDLDRPYNKGK